MQFMIMIEYIFFALCNLYHDQVVTLLRKLDLTNMVIPTDLPAAAKSFGSSLNLTASCI